MNKRAKALTETKAESVLATVMELQRTNPISLSDAIEIYKIAVLETIEDELQRIHLAVSRL